MGYMVLCRSHETIACSLYLKDLSNYHAILSMVEIPTLIKCTIVLPMQYRGIVRMGAMGAMCGTR